MKIFLLIITLMTLPAVAGTKFKNPEYRITFCSVQNGTAYHANLDWEKLEKHELIKLTKNDEIEFHIKVENKPKEVKFTAGKGTEQTEWFVTFTGGGTLSDELSGFGASEYYFSLHPKSQDIGKTLKDSCLADPEKAASVKKIVTLQELTLH